jgi:excisionase family DNA binding protein
VSRIGQQPGDERLTVSDVAEELEISERTVRRIIDNGELVAYRITARKVYVLRRDLDTFVRSRRTTTANTMGG